MGLMAQAVRSEGRARQLVDRLCADWVGESWDDVVIDSVVLVSSADQWPPLIRLDYRIGGKRGRWLETWEGEALRTESLEAASGLWLSIVSIHLMDLAEPPPEHRKAAR